MVTLRCTRKLLDKLPSSANVVTKSEPSATALGDWYLTYLPWRPKHLLFGVSEHSRLAVLFPSAPLATFVPRFVEALRAVLQASVIAEVAINHEIKKMAAHQFAPTQSRSVLGTLNEYVKTLEYGEGEEDESQSPLELSLFLNRSIWRPLEYKTPEEVTRHLLEPNP